MRLLIWARCLIGLAFLVSLGALLLVLGGCGEEDSAPPPAPAPGQFCLFVVGIPELTFQTFSAIAIGMDHCQVADILHSSGTEVASSGAIRLFEWTGFSLVGGRFVVIDVTFENGRVIAKAQSGL